MKRIGGWLVVIGVLAYLILLAIVDKDVRKELGDG